MYDRPGFLLRRAHQISAALFEEECRDIALTQAQFAVLTVLAAKPGVDQPRLCRFVGFDKVTVMYILRGLIERGLVVRESMPGKKRLMALSLTKEGVKLLESAQRPTETAYTSLMSCFTDAQQRQFLKLLKILTEALEDKARAPLVLPESANSEE
jgi:DNA-binding MarR family transcriptional regulator